jgi:glycosyltransferase involved in cell wall biosynthesis
MDKKNVSLLLMVPSDTASGGVTTYTTVIKNELSVKHVCLIRGNKKYPYKNSTFSNLIRLFTDMIIYLGYLLFAKFNIVQTNTSFDKPAILRDGFYILMAKLFRKKVIVFFHGWDKSFVEYIDKNHLGLFCAVYFKANAFIVLSLEFKEVLVKWGYNKPIYLETTIVDKKLLSELPEDFLHFKFSKEMLSKPFSILFLARIEKTKGIYEAVDTFHLLGQKFPDLLFTIVGDGTEFENVKQYIQEKKIKNIQMPGFKTGNELARAYSSSTIYLFPSYSEGMPTTVLEAMAFGLPVITRPVGGLKDFFMDGKMGYMTESLDPLEYAQIITSLIRNPETIKEIALFNYTYVKDHFISNVVVQRIEAIYQQTLNE